MLSSWIWLYRSWRSSTLIIFYQPSLLSSCEDHLCGRFWRAWELAVLFFSMLRAPSIVIGRTSATVPPQWSTNHKCVTVLHGRNVNKLTTCNGIFVLSLRRWPRGLVVFPSGVIPVTTPARHRPLARLVTQLHGMVPLFIYCIYFLNWITGSESWTLIF